MGLIDKFKNQENKKGQVQKDKADASRFVFTSDLEAGKEDGLDAAYAYLKQCKDNGINTYVSLYYRADFYPTSPRRHKWLESKDVTTLDNLYVQVYGCPKAECFKRKAQTQTRLKHQAAESGYVDASVKAEAELIAEPQKDQKQQVDQGREM